METIDDLPIEEGQALVWDLLRHTVQPSNAFLRPWERGDLLVWDQRRVFHGRVPYELRDDDPRLMCAFCFAQPCRCFSHRAV